MSDAAPLHPVTPEFASNLPGVLHLADQLRPLLMKLGRRLRSETQVHGLTSSQITLLMVLHKQPGIGVAELAAAEGITGPTLIGHLNNLENLGLLQRCKPDGGDRRRTVLQLTALGLQRISEVKALRTHWLASRLEHLSAEHQEALQEALEPLRALLDQEP